MVEHLKRRREEVAADDALAVFDLVYGEEDIAKTDNDLLWLLEQNDKSGEPLPKLYLCCGTEDFLYEDNLSFLEKCQQTRFDLTYEFEPGTHEWGFWDKKIQDVLAWLPISKSHQVEQH